MPSYGDRIDEFEVGSVKVIVRYGCARRDQYELKTSPPLPRSFRDALAATGVVKGSESLYVVDVPETHQITVAPNQGRVVIMPRLSLPREQQRAHATEVAKLLATMLDPNQGPNGDRDRGEP